MNKTLCVNLGEKGGCVYYANNLIKNMSLNSDIWLHPLSECSDGIVHKSVKLAKMRLRFFLLISPLVFVYFFIYLSFCILFGKYNRVIVFGPHIIDFMILAPFRVWGKKAIYVVHDGVMHTGDAPKAYQIEIKWSMRIASELIFLSEYTRGMVKQELGIEKKSFIVPHGIVTYSNAKAETHMLSSKIGYLLIGRITSYKGVDIIFDYLNTHPDFNGIITIAGKFSSDIVIPPKIKSDMRLVLDDRWLSGEDIDKYMRQCDVVLMPYHEATQSGVAAMSIGYCKPVIATDVGALREQLGNSAYYMPNDDVDSFAEALRHVENKSDYEDKIKVSIELNKAYQWANLAKSLDNYISCE